MKSKNYIYFASYLMFSKEKGFGFGRCEVIRTAKIKNLEDIATIEKELEKENKATTVAIINYKPFRIEEIDNENTELE